VTSAACAQRFARSTHARGRIVVGVDTRAGHSEL
jgi:hypothetical protein